MILTPETDIAAAVAAQGGPGVVFEFAPGRYRFNLRLYGEVARHNGAPGNPMVFRSTEPHGATIEAETSGDDLFNMFSARHIVIEGFRLIGPSDATRQAIHAHAEVKKGTVSRDITVRNCLIFRRGGDGIKFSEVEGGLIEGCDFRTDRIPEGAKESAIDCNKSNGVTIRGCTIRDTNTGVIFKGGGVGLVFDGNTVNAWKGAEIGGHAGTGAADGFTGNWAAKSITLRSNQMHGSEYPLRFIGAHDVVMTGNTLTGGEIMISDSRQEGGVFTCSNIVRDGVVLVPKLADPEPVPEPEPALPPNTFIPGDAEKITYSVGAGDLPVITLKGFGLDAGKLRGMAREKSDSLVIVDLRGVNGPQLTLKGKNIRGRWLAAFKFN